MMTWFAVASIFGFGIIGGWCDRQIRRGRSPLTLYKLQAGTVILLFGLMNFASGSLALAMWIVYFLVGSGGALVLAALTRQFPAHLAGRVNTASNVLMFVISFSFQWGIGAVLDQWPVIEGRYSPSGYHAAFLALLAIQLCVYAVLLYAERPTDQGAPDRPQTGVAR